MSNCNLEMDLDISNYSLNELLNLFNLSTDFDSDDLKRAYKQTLMTHPDKSGLSKEYFLFFSKAFKHVKYLFDYRKNNDEYKKCAHKNSQEYKSMIDSLYNNKDKHIRNKIQQRMEENKKGFNDKFNALFEKVRIHDDEHDNGYDEWIKTTPVDDENITITNTRSLNEYIEQKKQQAKSLIIYNGVEELNSCNMFGNTSNLKREKPQYYESGIFSKMQYDDYKRAHSETVIPVTYDDYLNRKHFNNVNEMMTYRKQNESMPSLEQSNKILKQKQKNEQAESVEIAYNLTKQMEKIQESNKVWNANFNLLLDK